MSRVDQVAQTNASAAEELASTSEEMAAQASALRERMGCFRLLDGDAGNGSHPAAGSPEPSPPVVSPAAMAAGTGAERTPSRAASSRSEAPDYERF